MTFGKLPTSPASRPQRSSVQAAKGCASCSSNLFKGIGAPTINQDVAISNARYRRNQRSPFVRDAGGRPAAIIGNLSTKCLTNDYQVDPVRYHVAKSGGFGCEGERAQCGAGVLGEIPAAAHNPQFPPANRFLTKMPALF